ARLKNHEDFQFVIDSIMNEMILDRLVSESNVIIHLAAAVGVKLIVEKPVHTIETNVTGTMKVLQAAVRYRVKVLIASTSEVYGKGNHIPFREDDDVVLGPTSRSRWSYAASKMIDEFLALSYAREKDIPVVIFRLFNTIGPRQTGQYGMVVPRFIQQALAGKPLTVYGDGNQSRCFLHVKDAVEAIAKLAESPRVIGEVLNVGSTEEITIRDLAKLVIAIRDRELDTRLKQQGRQLPNQIMYIPYDEAYTSGFEDMQRRVPDISKIAAMVGWQPKWTLQQSIEDILRANLSEKPEEYH
ncbi:MAG: NAD-dependent epimerase/dehydratase family protein, partial [Anaerolineales bacterium]